MRPSRSRNRRIRPIASCRASRNHPRRRFRDRMRDCLPRVTPPNTYRDNNPLTRSVSHSRNNRRVSFQRHERYSLTINAEFPAQGAQGQASSPFANSTTAKLSQGQKSNSARPSKKRKYEVYQTAQADPSSSDMSAESETITLSAIETVVQKSVEKYVKEALRKA